MHDCIHPPMRYHEFILKMGQVQKIAMTDQERDKNLGNKEGGRLTRQLNGLQERLEAYSLENSWVSRWKDRVNRFFDLRVGVNAAASAFYLLFSLFPLIIFVFSLLDLLDPGLAQRFEEALPQLGLVIPEPVLKMFLNFLTSVARTSSIPFLSLSALGLLWAASRGTANIVNSMNRIYHKEMEFNFLLRRLIGILAIFVISVLLAAILILLAFYRLAIDFLQQFFSLPDFIMRGDFDLLAHLVAFLALTLIFTTIYALVKRQRSYFRHTVMAAMVAATGWLLISYGLSYFITIQTRYYLMYGSITGIIFLMLWLYLAVYISMLGAFVHAELIRTHPRPEKKKKGRRQMEA